jgi:hypothetical protein
MEMYPNGLEVGLKAALENLETLPKRADAQAPLEL